MVSIKNKVNFLDWFIVHSIFTKREAYWLLTYLKEHPAILENVMFIEEAERTPRGLVFEQGSEPEDSFVFFKNNEKITDHEKIFHDIRFNWQDTLYVTCRLSDGWQNQLYLSVLEDNPFASWNKKLPKELATTVANEISDLTSEQQQIELLKAIDCALDNQDFETFKQLSETYQHMT